MGHDGPRWTPAQRGPEESQDCVRHRGPGQGPWVKDSDHTGFFI